MVSHRVSFRYLEFPSGTGVLLPEPLYNICFFCNDTFVQHIFENP